MKRLLMALWAAAFVLVWAGVSFALDPVFTGGGNDAIGGYDPVAYFTKGRPVRGNVNYTHEWNGVRWRFSSQENRDRFASDPKAYAPQYGGYCAWAVSQGYTASTVPEAWSIHKGKLYLNYSKGVRRQWERNKDRNVQKGDKNWPKLLK